VGVGSLIWLLLRSGTKPKRLTYPCQRVAASNSLGFLAYLAALLSSATFLRRLKKVFSPGRLALLVASLLLTVFLQGSATVPEVPIFADSPDLPGWTHPDAVSNVFAVANVPEPEYSLNGGTVPGGVSAADALHDDGVDALVNFMEAYGDYFYKTAAHSQGLFGSSDVIVIKVNNQWDGRNGTNTDVVKGVIYRLVQHPEGFTGAVIIAENTQEHNADWYHEPSGNNSQFQNQSYQEVAQAFAGQGYHICTYDWRSIRGNYRNDYDASDNNDGYVLEDADTTPQEQGHKRLSYPKFQVNCNGMNLRISMKKGLWNGSGFDNTRLKMINLPVLKRHNSAWATISVKNYLGFVTLSDGVGRWQSPGYKHCWIMGRMDNSENCTQYTIEYGLVARQMARIRRADLNIVDAIWVNPRDNAAYHSEAQRQDVLLASRDPFAVDYYASDFILGPLIQQTYDSSSGYEQAMASTHGGWFRNIQRYNVARLRAEGVTDTINMDDSMTRQKELDQFNVYVADAGDLLVPSLTLQVPNGGETWRVGTQEQIEWSSTGQVGNVKLEYSTDGFGTSHTIVSSTENDGTHTWKVPSLLSTDVLVRVSSTITTVNDTSDAVFTIVGRPFEDSSKMVSDISLEGGETITYTIVLYEEIGAMLTLTDTVPSLLTYESSDVEPSWKNPIQYIGGDIRWSDTVTGAVPVTITFWAEVPITDTTRAIMNHALISHDGAAPIERRALSILNGFSAYLPLTLKSY
jgi:uncharacterized protein (DUF362 family)